MIAIGDYALIRIDLNTTSSGIQVKNDGIGHCVSCSINEDLEGRKVLIDMNHKHHEFREHLVVNVNHILLVLGDVE
tara:strand:- start:4344 stop:4571 length:228 start_codon:yes stop_codon:yes gene_type:complete